MAKAVKIMGTIAKILTIISLIIHIPGCLTIGGIAGLIVSILTLKQIKNGTPSIGMGVANILLTFGANVVFGLPVVGALLIVMAILNKKLNAAEYVEEAEELVEE